MSLNNNKHAQSAANKRRRRLLRVHVRPSNRQQGLLCFGKAVFPCALGRGSVRSLKREGDGATPLGAWRVLHGYFRADRLRPGNSLLRLRAIRRDDGWCDAPDDRNYNRPVRLPYPASAESMMRDDRLYDVCIVLDCNIAPRRRGMGSAIFFHVAKPGFPPTQGCIAVEPRVMRRLLPYLDRNTVVEVAG